MKLWKSSCLFDNFFSYDKFCIPFFLDKFVWFGLCIAFGHCFFAGHANNSATKMTASIEVAPMVCADDFDITAMIATVLFVGVRTSYFLTWHFFTLYLRVLIQPILGSLLYDTSFRVDSKKSKAPYFHRMGLWKQGAIELFLLLRYI